MTETTVGSLLDAVDQIAPILREHGPRSEEQRRLAERERVEFGARKLSSATSGMST